MCQLRAEFFYADVQADMTKLIVACRNFANVPENAALAVMVGCRRMKWQAFIYMYTHTYTHTEMET